MNLFIDTNVYLSFFHFSKDSLTELEKVFVLQQYGKLDLWLTDQVETEFRRNREVKIADALKRFLEERPSSGVPQMAQTYPECEQLLDALKRVTTAKEKLLSRLQMDIAARSLYADKLIDTIFKKAKRVSQSEKQIAAAERRALLRNPPGKNNSLGDAINWEALLEAIPNGEDLFLVSEDGDFASAIDPERMSDFLIDEWAANKKAKVLLSKRLSQILSAQFPEAKVAAELEKEILIKDLANSGTFARTHQLIARLQSFKEFTPKQASDLVDAYITNAQIHWIPSDPDVQAFGRCIEKEHGGSLDPNQLKAFLGVLSK
jgi:hypothetical protein